MWFVFMIYIHLNCAFTLNISTTTQAIPYTLRAQPDTTESDGFTCAT